MTRGGGGGSLAGVGVVQVGVGVRRGVGLLTSSLKEGLKDRSKRREARALSSSGRFETGESEIIRK